MNEQPASFINSDPDFGLATALAGSLVGGASRIPDGIGAILAGEVSNELSDFGRIVAEHPVVFTTLRDPVSVVDELRAVLARMLSASDGLDEALRVTRAQEIARQLLAELADPTTFESADQGDGQ